MSRRESRILAFQGLFSWDLGNAKKEDVLTLNWTASDPDFAAEKEAMESSDGQESASSKFNIDDETATFARLLIAGTIDNIETIDSLIKKNLKNWTFDRVNKVTIAVLRISIYQLLFTKDIDARIVIDEAVDISKNYGPDDSYKFVNALLDNINKNQTEG